LITFVAVYSLKSMEGSSYTAPLILNPDIGLRWADSYSSWPPFFGRCN